MEELLPQISESIRERTKFVFDMALLQRTPWEMIKVLNEYTQTCIDPEEKEFTQFYFNMRMEQLKNDSNSNIG